MDAKLCMESFYPIFHESAQALLASGTSAQEILDEMAEFLDPDDPYYSAAVRRAYEDVLR